MIYHITNIGPTTHNPAFISRSIQEQKDSERKRDGLSEFKLRQTSEAEDSTTLGINFSLS